MIETVYHIPGVPNLALLSDLHNRPFDQVIASLQRHKPTLIAITGDVLYGSQPEENVSPLDIQENVLPFLRSCASIVPTYLSLGNHEWMLDDTDLATISSTGVVILDNAYQTITVENRKIILAGLTSGYVTDYRSFRSTQPAEPRYPRQEDFYDIGGVRTEHKPGTAWLAEYCSTPGFHLLLSHHPEYYSFIPSTVNLILSGHAHGGQWRIFGRGVWSPGQGLLPQWSRGVYEGRLVVSAGLSNTTWIPRLWNPTEIVYLEP